MYIKLLFLMLILPVSINLHSFEGQFTQFESVEPYEPEPYLPEPYDPDSYEPEPYDPEKPFGDPENYPPEDIPLPPKGGSGSIR